jgi:hypothetical protein
VQAVVDPGTYFARVVSAGVDGAYSVSFDLLPPVDPPLGSCAAPFAAVAGTINDDTSAGDAVFAPTDPTCLGFPPYEGPEAVYQVSVPAGFTLTATLDADADLGVAIVAGDVCDEAACVTGDDSDFGGTPEVATFTNASAAEATFLIIIEGFNGEVGPFSLDIAIADNTVPPVCAQGEQRCSAGGDVETCTADGTGFAVSQTCSDAGCEVDTFNLTARCAPVCGAGTAEPDDRCLDGVTLEVCREDQSGYDTVTCAGACVGDASDGFCTFGLCAVAELGTTTCVSADVFGDATQETFLLACNDDASQATRDACDVGAACAGDTCANTGTLQVICAANTSSCTDGVETLCDAAGNSEAQTFCALGCDDDAVACDFPIFTENCTEPTGRVDFPADGETLTFALDTTGAIDDVVSTGCGLFENDGAEDIVTSFIANETTSVTVSKDAFDGVIAIHEGVCGGASLICEDDFAGANPDLDSVTFSVTSGTESFIVIAAVFAGQGGATTLSITNE